MLISLFTIYHIHTCIYYTTFRFDLEICSKKVNSEVRGNNHVVRFNSFIEVSISKGFSVVACFARKLFFI